MSFPSKSGLRRSHSSSSISQPFRLSRLPVRNSAQKSRGKSLNRQDKLSVDRNVTRSSSNLTPCLSRQHSGSLVRQTATPLGSRSGRISPRFSSLRKDERPLGDKRWQYEQTVKVRNFVAAELSYLDHNNIKSGIPLDLFVGVMDAYFKLIDQRISITRDNYIEEVPTNLKRYRYLASVKPSLMKTLNAPHSWPHVIAILSWLTDIIHELNRPVLPTSKFETILGTCFTEMYKRWSRNPGDSAEFEVPLGDLDFELGGVVKTNDKEMSALDKEMENLRAETEPYTHKKNDKIRKLQRLQTNIQSINGKCDIYSSAAEKFETDMSEQHTKCAMKLKKTDQELAASLKREEQLKAVVAAQPHTVAEQQQLVQEIKDMQNTVNLKEDRCKQQRELVTAYDFQCSDVKQQMEANAFQYNNVVHQLELANPEYKKLLIRESGFPKRDTEDEIKEAGGLLREARITLEQELAVSDKKLEELAQKQKQLDEKFLTVKKEEKNLSILEAELNITLTHKKKKDEREREKTLAEINKHRNKLLTLKNSKCDVTALQEALAQINDRKHKLPEFKQDLVDRAQDFFLRLERRMTNNLLNHMDVMEELAVVFMSWQEKAIENSKARIKALKEARKEAEDKEGK